MPPKTKRAESPSETPRRAQRARKTAVPAPAAAPRRAHFPSSPDALATTATKFVPMSEHIADVKYTEETLTAFFQQKIQTVTESWGQHFRGNVDVDTMDSRQYQKSFTAYASQLLPDSILRAPIEGPTIATADSTMPLYKATYTILGAFQKYTVADLLRADIRKNFNDRAIHLAVITLLRGGLENFFRFGHCKNLCPATLHYPTLKDVPAPDPARPETHMYSRQFGMDYPEVYQACNASHRRMEQAFQIYDIRYLDYVLKEASGGRCSIALPS